MKYSVQLFFGKSFTGKTARMLHELRAESRVILVDPKCAQLTSLPRYKHFWPEIPVKGNCWTRESSKAMLSFLRFHAGGNGAFSAVIHFRDCFRQNLELVSAVAMSVKNCVMAVDECGLFIPPGPAMALPPRITNVIVSGTHDGVRFMGTAQRPSLVHGTVRANASRMFFYRMTETADLAVSSNYLPADLMEKLPNLPDYCCIEWTDGGNPFADHSMPGKFRVPGKR